MTYSFESTPGTDEDARELIKRIVAQALKDYVFYYHESRRVKPDDIEAWETAKGLLFDNNYTIKFGLWEMGINQLVAEAYGYEKANFKMIIRMRKRIELKAKAYWKERGIDDNQEA